MGAIVALLCALSGVLAGVAGAAGAASITNSGNDLRDGWYGDQPRLSPGLVEGSTFGQMWSTPVSGQVYMQPLVHAGKVIVATERNRVYSLDAATGTQTWTATLGNSWRASDIGCGDLWPEIGVTATPVIDPASNTIYLTHKTYALGTSGPAAWYMDALDASTGLQRSGFPVKLSGEAQNNPGVTFNATTELQRPGLLLLDGVVYAAFGGHCDIRPYQGWVFGVSTAGAIRARWSALPKDYDGAGIWQSGAGLMSDGPGRIFLSTGNGGSPLPPRAGKDPNGMFGQSIVRLAVQPDGSLKAMDFFAPYDADILDRYDADFASGGVTALRDDAFGTATHPHLAVAVGKAGYVYLVDRDELGGVGMGLGGGDAALAQVGPYGGVWSRPGVWPGDGGWIIIPTASGVTGGPPEASGSSGHLMMYHYGEASGGKPSLALAAQSDDPFGFSSSAPVITSDGLTSGTALAWTVWAPNGNGEGAQLRAYDAVPAADGHLRLRKSLPIGQSAKFATPGVGDGHIYVGTRDGKVLGFGAPIQADVQAPATSFPVTTVGESSHRTVTLTAGRHLTITSIGTSSATFTPQAGALGLPKTLDYGETLTVPVDFAPTAPGAGGGSLVVQTDTGSFSFSLSGTGQAATALLTTTPPAISFGGTVVGRARTAIVTFGNGGGQPLTVTAVDMPGAPFLVTDAPAVDDKIAAGHALNVTVKYAPVVVGPATDELTLHTSAGNATIGLTGSAGVGPRLIVEPTGGWSFGAVPVGSSKTIEVTLSNTGDSALTITKSKPPTGEVLAVLDPLAEGSIVEAGASRTLRVRFSPTTVGPVTDGWTITGDDGGGQQVVPLTGEGVIPSPEPGPKAQTDGGATTTPPSNTVTAAVDAAALTPPPVGPDLTGQGTRGPLVERMRPDLYVSHAGLTNGGRNLRITGRIAREANGPLSATVSARVGRKSVTMVAGKQLLGTSTYSLTLALPRVARLWSRLRVSVRFPGSDRVWPGVGSLVVVRGR